ncbi:MAG: c-type cytochrome [Desulfobulbaceae bacterium]|nr:c-type cytochrome [Desulfobulbaceae bacterium]
MKKVLASAAVFSLFLGAGSVSAQTLTTVEKLGGLLYSSPILSYNYMQSCADCHAASSGFADPDKTAVSVGADGTSTGGRNAPTAAYAGFSPILHQDQTGEWVGGMFWDGRATGKRLHDPLAEQAQGPPENPVEMNNTREEIIARIADPGLYVDPLYYQEALDINALFLEVYGDVFANVDLAYDYLGRAIAAYERSSEVTSFTSVFDTEKLSGQALQGKKLFMQNCTTCHAYGRHGGANALFTNHKYVNAGVPANLALNPDPANPDLGLGPIVGDPDQNGKFKVPTLRNVALTAPYSHNGYFDNLYNMVSFMNNRDNFPAAEYVFTVSDEVGHLGLNDQQVKVIVAFLNTLTDDPPVPTP